MGWRTYYWQWIKRAVWHAPGIADYLLSVSGLAVVVVAHFLPKQAEAMNAHWWQVILWTFAGVTALRFVLAPYLIAKDREALLAGEKGRADLAESAAARAQDALAAALRPAAPVSEPDAIYQHGRIVGRVLVPRNLGQGKWTFDEIIQAVNFDQAQPFQYHDLTLLHVAHQSEVIGHDMNGPNRSLMGVTARVVG